MTWKLDTENQFRVQWTGNPRQVNLWKATSLTRDFREVQWTSERLDESKNEARQTLESPKQGYVAYYIDVEFPGVGVFNYNIATEIQVLPKGFRSIHHR